NNADDLRVFFAHKTQQGRAIHPRHPHVRDHDIKRRSLHNGERGIATGRESHFPFMSLGTQHALQPVKELLFVVYKEHSSHGAFIFWEHPPGSMSKASDGLQTYLENRS